eukprot:1431266-Prymnesium_polylepis.1
MESTDAGAVPAKAPCLGLCGVVQLPAGGGPLPWTKACCLRQRISAYQASQIGASRSAVWGPGSVGASVPQSADCASGYWATLCSSGGT